MTRVFLSCFTAGLSARGRTFARINSFGRDRQSHLGLVVHGPSILEGTLGALGILGVSTHRPLDRVTAWLN